ncbi:flagellar filament capping protein FliD [candidate division KSB1 bacterium]
MVQISSLSSQSSIEELVSRFSKREQLPITALQEKKTSLTRKSAVLVDLKSNLNTLRTRAKGFTSIGAEAKLAKKSAVSSNESLFTVSADATAARGVNTISISRIARNDVGISSQFDSSDFSLAGALSGTHQFTVQVGSNTAQTISVTISAGDTDETVLENIASAINTYVEDATAKVITSSRSKVRLSIVSDESGSENEISLTAVGGSEILEELGFVDKNSTDRREFKTTKGGFVTEDTEDLDAVFEINGIEITSSSNSVTDVLEGVTINLRKAQDAGESAETFTIAPDIEDIKSQVEGFIEDYNSALQYLTEKLSVDTTTNERGVLAGNFTFTRLRLQLRQIVSSPVEDISEGNPELITQVGIEINADGSLSLDEDEFEEAALENPTGVTDLFTSTIGVASQLTGIIEQYTLAGAVIDKNISSVNRQTETAEKQISGFESRLKIQEESLRRKFTELERMLQSLNSQQTLLNRLVYSPFQSLQTSPFSITNLFQTSS